MPFSSQPHMYRITNTGTHKLTREMNIILFGVVLTKPHYVRPIRFVWKCLWVHLDKIASAWIKVGVLKGRVVLTPPTPHPKENPVASNELLFVGFQDYLFCRGIKPYILNILAERAEIFFFFLSLT